MPFGRLTELPAQACHRTDRPLAPGELAGRHCSRDTGRDTSMARISWSKGEEAVARWPMGSLPCPPSKRTALRPGHPDGKARTPWKGESKPVPQYDTSSCVIGSRRGGRRHVLCDLLRTTMRYYRRCCVFIARVDASSGAQAYSRTPASLSSWLFQNDVEKPSVPACWRRPMVLETLPSSQPRQLTARAKSETGHAVTCRLDHPQGSLRDPRRMKQEIITENQE
ncbi:hypothetical protein V8C26DRAFT_93037 [Trichoderma gracile]